MARTKETPRNAAAASAGAPTQQATDAVILNKSVDKTKAPKAGKPKEDRLGWECRFPECPRYYPYRQGMALHMKNEHSAKAGQWPDPTPAYKIFSRRDPDAFSKMARFLKSSQVSRPKKTNREPKEGGLLPPPATLKALKVASTKMHITPACSAISITTGVDADVDAVVSVTTTAVPAPRATVTVRGCTAMTPSVCAPPVQVNAVVSHTDNADFTAQSISPLGVSPVLVSNYTDEESADSELESEPDGLEHSFELEDEVFEPNSSSPPTLFSHTTQQTAQRRRAVGGTKDIRHWWVSENEVELWPKRCLDISNDDIAKVMDVLPRATSVEVAKIIADRYQLSSARALPLRRAAAAMIHMEQHLVNQIMPMLAASAATPAEILDKHRQLTDWCVARKERPASLPFE